MSELRAALPDAPWRQLVVAYTVGFAFVVLLNHAPVAPYLDNG